METTIMLGILLLIAGFILIGIEMVVPGFGLPGISGICCLIGGILLTLKRVRPPFILEDELKTSAEYLNASDLEYLVGKEGTASTDLKPSGKCNVEGVEFDVRAESTYIKKGTKVQISLIHENTIMIRQL